MERNETKKIVYEDAGRNKVIKGLILKEDEFTYTIKAQFTHKVITIGKRAIVKIYEESGDRK